MTNAFDTKNIGAFAANSTPKDTDYFLTATGNVAKKTTVAQVKNLLGVNSGFKLLQATEITFSVPSLTSGQNSGAITTAFDTDDDATLFVPICLSTGWLTCASCSASAGSLKTSFVNPGASAHGSSAKFIVLQFSEF